MIIAYPYLPIVSKFGGFWVFEVLRPNMLLIVYKDLFHRPLHRSRCQSGTYTHFALGRFSVEGDVVPFRDDMHDKYLITIPKECGTRW